MMLTATANSDDTVDIVGKQGTNWAMNIEVYSDSARTVPLDLTGYSVRGQMRKRAKATSPILIDFTCAIVPFHPSSNPDTNKITVQAAPEDTEDLTTFSGVYDIEIHIDETTVECIQSGTVTITPGVTHIAPVETP